MQHTCNMEELFSRFKTSDFGDTSTPESDFVAFSDPSLLAHQQRLGRLKRLGINKEEFASAEREVRIDHLGLGDLTNRKTNPRHRPPSANTALDKDGIVQMVLFERALFPDQSMKSIINDVHDAYGVERSYVYRCLEECDPKRRQEIEMSVMRLVFGGELLAWMSILAASK
jgi:hypothetical protein